MTVIFSHDVYPSLPPLSQALSSGDTQAKNALALCLVQKELISQGLAQCRLLWMPFPFTLRAEDVTPVVPFSQLFNSLVIHNNTLFFSFFLFGSAGSSHRLCLVAASGATLSVWSPGFPLWWRLLLWSTDSGCAASAGVVHRLVSCSSRTLEHRPSSYGAWA